MGILDRFRKKKKLRITAGALLPYKLSNIDGENIKWEPFTNFTPKEEELFNKYKLMLKQQGEIEGEKVKRKFIFGFWCRECKKVPDNVKKCFKRKHTILQAIIGEEREYNFEENPITLKF